MKLVIHKETLTVTKLEDFLRQNRNITVAGHLVTQELLEVIDPALILHEMDTEPHYNDKFELLELSTPILIEGKPVIFWEIKRLGRDHINDYYNDAVEAYVDAIAKDRGWKNQDRLLSNLTSSNANFAQEARYMLQLRDRIWEKALPVINAEVGELVATPERRPMPIAKLLEDLPKWQMPDGF